MYETFLSTFLEFYEINFPCKQVPIKPKDVKNPWMSKALKQSSLQKQNLYVKYLKQKTKKHKKTDSEKTYKDYKNLFSKFKKRKKAKNNFEIKKLSKCQRNTKRTKRSCQVMKKITSKIKQESNTFPKALKIN